MIFVSFDVQNGGRDRVPGALLPGSTIPTVIRCRSRNGKHLRGRRTSSYTTRTGYSARPDHAAEDLKKRTRLSGDAFACDTPTATARTDDEPGRAGFWPRDHGPFI